MLFLSVWVVQGLTRFFGSGWRPITLVPRIIVESNLFRDAGWLVDVWGGRFNWPYRYFYVPAPKFSAWGNFSWWSEGCWLIIYPKVVNYSYDWCCWLFFTCGTPIIQLQVLWVTSFFIWTSFRTCWLFFQLLPFVLFLLRYFVIIHLFWVRVRDRWYWLWEIIFVWLYWSNGQGWGFFFYRVLLCYLLLFCSRGGF